MPGQYIRGEAVEIPWEEDYESDEIQVGIAKARLLNMLFLFHLFPSPEKVWTQNVEVAGGEYRISLMTAIKIMVRVHAQPEAEGGHWLWQGGVGSRKVPMVQLPVADENGRGEAVKNVPAARVIYDMLRGIGRTSRLLPCDDEPRCVRPDHQCEQVPLGDDRHFQDFRYTRREIAYRIRSDAEKVARAVEDADPAYLNVPTGDPPAGVWIQKSWDSWHLEDGTALDHYMDDEEQARRSAQ